MTDSTIILEIKKEIEEQKSLLRFFEDERFNFKTIQTENTRFELDYKRDFQNYLVVSECFDNTPDCDSSVLENDFNGFEDVTLCKVCNEHEASQNVKISNTEKVFSEHEKQVKICSSCYETFYEDLQFEIENLRTQVKIH